jgi:hypothetical protein
MIVEAEAKEIGKYAKRNVSRDRAATARIAPKWRIRLKFIGPEWCVDLQVTA